MTTDTGLTNRLRQHSRRAGLAVGLAMALTTAICIGGFAVIYAQLQPFISDFVSQEAPVDDDRAFTVGRNEDRSAPTAEAATEEPPPDEAAGEDAAPPVEEAPAPTVPPPPPPTPAPDTFTPDLQSNSNAAVNLRSEPSTAGGPATIITALPAATPIQYLGERVPTEDPAEDGDFWIRVRKDTGEEGWIREIDSEPFQA